MRWSRTKWNWLIFGGSPVLLAVVAVLGFLGYGKLLNRRAHMAWKAAGMISSPEELAEFCPPPAGPETDELDWLASQLAEAGIRDAWDPGIVSAFHRRRTSPNFSRYWRMLLFCSRSGTG